MKRKLPLAITTLTIVFLLYYFNTPTMNPSGDFAATPFLEEYSDIPPIPPSAIPATQTPYVTTNPSALATLPSGRAIDLYHYGADTTDILVIGGIHGSYEISSKKFVDEVIHTIQDGSFVLPPEKGISLIPCMNPDGCALKPAALEGRFNKNNVDLNRNWGAGWTEKAFLGNLSVSPGPNPFSEIETQTIRDYILLTKPKITILYHCCVDSGYVYLNKQAVDSKLFQTYLDSTKFAFDPNTNVVGGDVIEYLSLSEINLVGTEVEFPEGQRITPDYKLHLHSLSLLLQNLP